MTTDDASGEGGLYSTSQSLFFSSPQRCGLMKNNVQTYTHYMCTEVNSQGLPSKTSLYSFFFGPPHFSFFPSHFPCGTTPLFAPASVGYTHDAYGFERSWALLLLWHLHLDFIYVSIHKHTHRRTIMKKEGIENKTKTEKIRKTSNTSEPILFHSSRVFFLLPVCFYLHSFLLHED